jgi:hypothetical protein
VLALPLDNLSTKVRSGPPSDGAADRALPVWAGEIPVTLAFGTPQADELAADSEFPSSVLVQTAKGVRG